MPICWGSQIFCLELVSNIEVCQQLRRRDLSLPQFASLHNPIDSLQFFLDKKLIIMINPSLSFPSHFTSASSTFRMWPSSPPPPPPILNQISPYISSFRSLNHKPCKGSDHTPQLSSSKGALPHRAVPHMLFSSINFPKAGWTRTWSPLSLIKGREKKGTDIIYIWWF